MKKRKEHTFFYVYNTIHNFRVLSKRDKFDIMRGKYRIYKCTNCAITGRRYTKDRFITILKQYGQEKLSRCKMENVKTAKPGIFIRIIERISGYRKEKGTKRTNSNKNEKLLEVGSVHKIINTDGKKQHNDTKGVWVEGVKKPVKVANLEFEVAARSKRTKKAKKKSEPNVGTKKSKRTKW